MQIFELHFNPKAKEDYIFDTFIYEPKSSSEKKLGSLYISGDLKNAVPKKSSEFLSEVAKIVKKSYYSFPGKETEKALLQALKKANEYLAEEVKKENVAWLGNFNFAVLSLKDFELTFTATGDIKIVLIRSGKVVDIGRNLNLKEIEPYPLRVFFNTASGKISENDIILVATKEIYDFLKQQGSLAKLAQSYKLDSNKVKEIIPPSLFSKGEGSKLAGLSLIISSSDKKEKKLPFEMLFQKEDKSASSQKTSPLSILKKKIRQILKKNFSKSPLKISVPKLRLANPIVEKLKGKEGQKKKIIILIALFIFLLFLGFLISQNPREREITNESSEFSAKKIEGLKILMTLNKEEMDFEPERLALSSTTLYLYNPSSTKTLKLNIKSNDKEIVDIGKKINKIDSNSESIFIFSTESGILYSSLESWKEKKIEEPEQKIFSSYLSNFYFVNRTNCEITKYSYLTDLNWEESRSWHKNEDDTCINPKSITVDGSVWILNQDDTLVRYFGGVFMEKLSLNLNPEAEDIKKVETKFNLPYLYFIEPIQNRIVITDKNGELIKEFRNEGLDDLRDFSISEDGRSIYILNGNSIYILDL